MRLTIPTTVIFFLLSTTALRAEIQWLEVGINGLTCSMCSRTVEKSMLRLPFVDRVEMSLEATQAKVFLKKDVLVSMDEIARSVKSAGFSVRFIRMAIDAANLKTTEKSTFQSGGLVFSWLGKKDPADNSIRMFRLIDPGFMPASEKSKWSVLLAQSKTPGIHVVSE